MPTSPDLIDTKSVAGRRGANIPVGSEQLRAAGRARVPERLRRSKPAGLPNVSELDAVRHFTRLSQRNFSIDGNFYPLGSCTMKYNPKVNDQIASMPGFLRLHPLQDEADAQGTLRIVHELQGHLAKVLGMHEVSLAAAAGAQGEFAGMAIIRAYHESRGESHRNIVLVPDSAHGTNPASAALCGFKVRTIKSNKNGTVDLDSLRAAIDGNIAGIMLTNPNTCGVFERDILEVSRLVHEAGGQLYYDGANLNAIVGRIRPGDMGFDVIHINLHKTFSTPHGGGGPGAGAVGVAEHLRPFLPVPHVEKAEDGAYTLDRYGNGSIGRLMGFHGNTGVLIRALAYTLAHGGEGLWEVADKAVLNANYVLANLPEAFEAPFEKPCKHEALVTVRKAMKAKGIKAFDVAKRLLDYGFHAPTIYFPLLVPECLLIEPTETESKETLDAFIAAMHSIADEIERDAPELRDAPTTLAWGRLDDARAAKELNVCCKWTPESEPACAEA